MSGGAGQTSRILIVDDEPFMDLLEQLRREGLKNIGEAVDIYLDH